MGKSASKALIGAFVVGAVALAVAAVLIFGSERFLTRKMHVVMYFEGSVKGLNVGSPVMFRGVKIGSVTNIDLLFEPANLTFKVPVIAEIEPEKVGVLGTQDMPAENYFQPLVDKGMRAQLQVQSFVTGQLMVAMDFFPDKPAIFVGLDKRYQEIPTVPSSFEEISKTIGELPIHELVSKLTSAVDGLNKLVNSPEIIATIRSVDMTVRETGAVLKTINDQLGPIVTNLKDTSANLMSATAKVDQALSGENGLPARLDETLIAARNTLQQAERTLATLESSTSAQSPLAVEISGTLEEISSSARSVRFLSDYLQQHPEALLRGKKGP